MSDLTSHLNQMARYNTWANTHFAGFVGNAGEDAGVMSQVASFPSIRATLLHIWDAQFIWIMRIEGINITSWPGKEFSGSTLDAANGLVESSKQWELLVAGLESAELDRLVSYANIKGQPFTNTVSEIIFHVMNHSTFHRGQLVSMLRNAGFTSLTATDLIAFLRINRQ
jgi:uncharacterized damage-inducible protein DinB